GRVHHQVVIAAVQTNNHAFIHFGLRTDEQTTAFLQSVQGITQCLTAYHGHQYTVVTGRGQAGLNRTGVIKDDGEDAGTRGQRQEQTTETDQATVWLGKVQTNTDVAT